jgi:hypothetical protein
MRLHLVNWMKKIALYLLRIIKNPFFWIIGITFSLTLFMTIKYFIVLRAEGYTQWSTNPEDWAIFGSYISPIFSLFSISVIFLTLYLNRRSAINEREHLLYIEEKRHKLDKLDQLFNMIIELYSLVISNTYYDHDYKNWSIFKKTKDEKEALILFDNIQNYCYIHFYNSSSYYLLSNILYLKSLLKTTGSKEKDYDDVVLRLKQEAISGIRKLSKMINSLENSYPKYSVIERDLEIRNYFKYQDKFHSLKCYEVFKMNRSENMKKNSAKIVNAMVSTTES